jgi:hypothetical protein
MRIVKRTEGISTTDLVGRLLLMTKGHHNPAVDKPVQASPSITGLSGPSAHGFTGIGQSPTPTERKVRVTSLCDFKLPTPAVIAATVAAATEAAAVNEAASPVKTTMTTAVSPTPSNGDGGNDGEEPEHFARAISSFLPTTWRITQFSNHRRPTADDTVVYIDGSFDLFHVGHVKTLERAKQVRSATLWLFVLFLLLLFVLFCFC